MDIFKAYISGYVKGEPKIYNGGQTSCATFTVASFKGKDRDGESRGYAYNDVKAFGGTAEYVSQHVNDGTYVMIEATIEKGHFTNKEGKDVWNEDIKALNIKAFTPPDNQQNYGQNQQSYGQQNNYQGGYGGGAWK